ncbi:hypothetical protein TNCV_1755931 [Trichonephila clavipes]|nr:hypothetical protein TNCV_1755931 [Trichonephila clavipes]
MAGNSSGTRFLEVSLEDFPFLPEPFQQRLLNSPSSVCEGGIFGYPLSMKFLDHLPFFFSALSSFEDDRGWRLKLRVTSG